MASHPVPGAAPRPPAGEGVATDARGVLALTGERTLPGIPDERYWFLRHVIAYRATARWLTTLARDRASGGAASVLDAGCGEGYGLALLRAAGAGRVVGVDLDPATVAHARAIYAVADPDVEVERAELREIPLPDGAVDLTVSFQVIEHLHDIPGYLDELGRVTRAGGLIAISTPNRLTFSPGRDRPINPFHTVEFTADELTAVLTGAGYEVTERLGLHHAGRLAEVEAAREVSVPGLLADGEPSRWPKWLRELVHGVEETDFTLSDDHLDDSLDLLLVCRIRP